MARSRAIDYAQKQETILFTAARLFSREGVERSSMASIAAECGYSKALLYHYYDSKETLLFDIVSRHLILLLAAVDAAAASAESSAEQRLGAMIQALLQAYADNEDQHRIQLAGLASLNAEHTEQINALERELVNRFAAVIQLIMPGTHSKKMLKPVTMSMFGMLNWHYMWFREKGHISRDEFAALATRLIIHGAKELEH